MVVSAYVAGLAWFARSERRAWKLLPFGPLLGTLLLGIGLIAVAHDSPFTPS